jgi:hypothetical protein
MDRMYRWRALIIKKCLWWRKINIHKENSLIIIICLKQRAMQAEIGHGDKKPGISRLRASQRSELSASCSSRFSPGK